MLKRRLPRYLLLFILISYPFAFANPLQAQSDDVLQVAKTIAREMAPEQKHVYKVQLTSNQFIDINVEQNGLDVAVALLTPSGGPVFEIDSPNGRQGSEQIKAALADAGEYILEVRAAEKGAPVGRYSITLVEVRPAVEADFKAFQATRLYVEAGRLRSKRTTSALKEAVAKFAEAEKLRIELGDKHGQIQAIKFMGITYQILGESQTAIATYQRAIPIAKEIGDRSNEAALYNNIGFVYHQLDDFQNALFYMRLGLETNSQSDDEENAANLLENIGTTYSNLGEPEKAIFYFSRAQVIARKYNDRLIDARSTRNIGSAYAAMGDHEKALAMNLEALPVLREIKDKSGVSSSIIRIGTEYFALGDDQKALEFFLQGMKASEEASVVLDLASSHLGAGRVYDRRGDLNKAIISFKTALDLLTRLQTPRRTASVLAALAESQFKAGQYSEAERDMRKAVELIESVRNRISTQELRTSFFSKDNRQIYESFISLLMGLHERVPTKGYDKEAFQASEKARARSLLELLAVSRANIQQGVDSALLERERVLRTQLSTKATQLSSLLLARGAAEKITTAKGDYAKAEEELQQVEAQIRKASPRYAAISQAQTVSVTEAQALLDKDSALLEYSLGDDRSFLWVVTSDSMQTFELPKRADVEKRTRLLYELLTAQNRSIKFETVAEKRARIVKANNEILDASNSLSRMILAPAQSVLTKKRLLVVPDGGLYYVPFASLPQPMPATQSDKPLVLDHEVVNLPSASALALLRKQTEGRAAAPMTVAIFADPVFGREDERYKSLAKQKSPAHATEMVTQSRKLDGEDFNPLTRAIGDLGGGDNSVNLSRLPYTRREAAAIMMIASRQQSKSMLDFSATRGTALEKDLSQYRIIHFASHSFVSSIHPEVSGVVLSLIDEDGNDRDGFLRASDVYNLQLPADLIVLSGCRTGLGKEIRGEGLVGMTQSFMYAGAARVVVSLWDVQDEATAELMKRFYGGLLGRKKLSPAAALREAQVSMSTDRRWSSPYYWAGFTLQGEPR